MYAIAGYEICRVSNYSALYELYTWDIYPDSRVNNNTWMNSRENEDQLVPTVWSPGHKKAVSMSMSDVQHLMLNVRQSYNTHTRSQHWRLHALHIRTEYQCQLTVYPYGVMPEYVRVLTAHSLFDLYSTVQYGCRCRSFPQDGRFAGHVHV